MQCQFDYRSAPVDDNGAGHFSAPAHLFELGAEADSLSAGDFNHDAKLDIVVANFGESGVGPAGISVFLGNGDGTFSLKTACRCRPMPILGRLVADLNGDGNLDIVSSNNNETYLSVYLGNGDGTFAPAVFYGANVFPLKIAGVR